MTQAVEYRYRLDDEEFPKQAPSNHGLVAARLQRVWELVEYVAQHPGKRRAEIAAHFALSERQIQADLNLIKRQLGLPLVRRSGYRFAEHDYDERVELSLMDAQLLILLMRRARFDPGIPRARLSALETALPRLAPLHLRPLIAASMATEDGRERGGRTGELFDAITEAMVVGRFIRLHYPEGSPVHDHAPVFKPEVVFPFCGEWYVVGECPGRQRVMVFPLRDAVAMPAVI